MNGAQVLHAIDGRLRIRVCKIKHEPRMARDLCRAVRSLAGVRRVVANLVTGSVVITYDETRLSRAALRNELTRISGGDLSTLPVAPATYSTLVAFTGRQLIRTVLETAMRAALKRAVYTQ